jgi:N6-adenosine-specific RNA methylase IME4
VGYAKAFEVIDAWGFKYKTVGFTWAKTNKNTLMKYELDN